MPLPQVTEHGYQLVQEPHPPFIVGHPEPEKNSVGIFEYILASMLKVYLDVFKKDRGGCQVWECPKVPELGQRSTECKFLYIRQIFIN